MVYIPFRIKTEKRIYAYIKNIKSIYNYTQLYTILLKKNKEVGQDFIRPDKELV